MSLEMLKKILQTTISFIDTPRQIGKTTELRKVAERLGGIFIVPFHQARRSKYDIVLHEIEKEIIGRRGPIIFDTTTLKILLESCLSAISNYESLVEKVKKLLGVINDEVQRKP